MSVGCRGMQKQALRHFRRSWSYDLGALCALVIPCLIAGPTMAQRSIEPGQIERRIERPQPPKRLDPKVQTPPLRAPRPSGPGGKFVLAGVDVLGSTVFAPEELAALYESYLGRMISTRDIEAMVAAITAYYRDKGYVLSRAVIRPQPVEHGIVTVEIIEGYVARVKMAGDGAGAALRRYSERIRSFRPLRLADLERYVLLMNDLPGISVEPKLRELATPGAFELTMEIDHKPVGAAASIDNRGTNEIGPLQTFFSTDFNSVFGLNEQTSVSLFTVPDEPKELIFISAAHEQRIGSEGTRVFVSGAYSRLQTSTIDGFDSDGKGTRLSIGIAHPFVRQRDISLFASFSIDASRSEQQDGSVETDDRLRVLRLSGRLAVRDGWSGIDGLGIEISRGIDALGASRPGSTSLSRTDGDPDFTKIVIDASRMQPLGDHWSIRIAGSGQWTPETLLSAEEFSLGARQFGRGFDPSELSSSRGIGGDVEVGYGREPQWRFLQSYQVYVFGDGGAVWFDDDTSQGLASAGVGIRAELIEGVNIEIEYAKPFQRVVAEEGDRDGRIFVTLSGQF